MLATWELRLDLVSRRIAEADAWLRRSEAARPLVLIGHFMLTALRSHCQGREASGKRGIWEPRAAILFYVGQGPGPGRCHMVITCRLAARTTSVAGTFGQSLATQDLPLRTPYTWRIKPRARMGLPSPWSRASEIRNARDLQRNGSTIGRYYGSPIRDLHTLSAAAWWTQG